MTTTLHPSSREEAGQGLPELPEASAWVNFNVLTQKESIGRLPITSLQPGVYQHKRLYSEEQMTAHAIAAIAAKNAEAERLREALAPFAKISINGPGEIVPNGYASPAVWRSDVARARAALATTTQGEQKS